LISRKFLPILFHEIDEIFEEKFSGQLSTIWIIALVVDGIEGVPAHLKNFPGLIHGTLAKGKNPVQLTSTLR